LSLFDEGEGVRPCVCVIGGAKVVSPSTGFVIEARRARNLLSLCNLSLSLSLSVALSLAAALSSTEFVVEGAQVTSPSPGFVIEAEQGARPCPL
jgi:uncharacterized membrane protein